MENLIYVKEDLMIPQHYSFYDLIASKASATATLHVEAHLAQAPLPKTQKAQAAAHDLCSLPGPG